MTVEMAFLTIVFLMCVAACFALARPETLEERARREVGKRDR